MVGDSSDRKEPASGATITGLVFAFGGARGDEREVQVACS